MGMRLLTRGYRIVYMPTARSFERVSPSAQHEVTRRSRIIAGRYQAIARAGAGVNNIPLDKCTEQGVVVFNTPGANANAVKELVICSLLLSSRGVVQGVDWLNKYDGTSVAKDVEKNKSLFKGPEIYGKTLMPIDSLENIEKSQTLITGSETSIAYP